jgi:hypothetical protein
LAQAEVAVINSAWTVKAPLIGTFSTALTGLDVGARVMAARAARIKEIVIAFLFETRFRNMVLSSLERFFEPGGTW